MAPRAICRAVALGCCIVGLASRHCAREYDLDGDHDAARCDRNDTDAKADALGSAHAASSGLGRAARCWQRERFLGFTGRAPVGWAPLLLQWQHACDGALDSCATSAHYSSRGPCCGSRRAATPALCSRWRRGLRGRSSPFRRGAASAVVPWPGCWQCRGAASRRQGLVRGSGGVGVCARCPLRFQDLAQSLGNKCVSGIQPRQIRQPSILLARWPG